MRARVVSRRICILYVFEGQPRQLATKVSHFPRRGLAPLAITSAPSVRNGVSSEQNTRQTLQPSKYADGLY